MGNLEEVLLSERLFILLEQEVTYFIIKCNSKRIKLPFCSVSAVVQDVLCTVEGRYDELEAYAGLGNVEVCVSGKWASRMVCLVVEELESVSRSNLHQNV